MQTHFNNKKILYRNKYSKKVIFIRYYKTINIVKKKKKLKMNQT